MASQAMNAIPADQRRADAEAAADHRQLLRVLPAVILLYGALLPQEVRVEIGPLVLFAYRLILIALFPVVAIRLWHRRIRLHWMDGAYFAAALWIAVAMTVNYGWGVVERGGAILLDFLLPYLVARVSVRSIGDLRYCLVLLAPAVALVGALMAIESISHVPIVKPLAAQVFSPLPGYLGDIEGAKNNTYEIRLGLLRAQGPFGHQILAGLFLTILLPLYSFLKMPRKSRIIGVAGSCCAFFSVSSAAFLGLAIVAAFYAYHQLQKRVALFTWRRLVFALAAVAALLQIGSKSGLLGVLIRTVALNQQTAYYRTLIWEYGTASVADHPFFGIGYRAYEALDWMTASVDNEWLLGAIRFGVPYSVCIALVLVAAARIAIRIGAGSQPFVEPAEGVGLFASLSVMVIVGATVSFYSGVLVLVPIVLAACASLATSGAPQAATSYPPAASTAV